MKLHKIKNQNVDLICIAHWLKYHLNEITSKSI